MPFRMPSFENWIACAAISLMMYVVASLRSSRLRGLVVSMPIPLTLVLWSQPEMQITAGHVLGMLLLVGFFWSNWVLYSKLCLPIAVSMLIAIGSYIFAGSLTRCASSAPYLYALAFAVVWLVYVRVFYRVSHQTVDTDQVPAWVKACGTFVICAFFFSLRETIGPALATAPLVSTFSIVECRKVLKTICLEFTRNVIGIVAYFVVYATVPGPFWVRTATSWAVLFVMLGFARMATSRRVPRVEVTMSEG